MGTSQAFRVALHIPTGTPGMGNVVTVETPGAEYVSGWEIGAAGASGSLILVGSGAPVDGLGNTGNFYVDTTADRIYGPKAASSPYWPDALNLTPAEIVSRATAADGAGSNLDSDFLDGNTGTFYTNLANQTGNLDVGTF